MTKKLVRSPTDLRADPKSLIALNIVKDMVCGKAPIETYGLSIR